MRRHDSRSAARVLAARVLAAQVSLLAVAAAATGCAVDLQDHPAPISSPEARTPHGSTTSPRPSVSLSVAVFFVRGARLEGAQRQEPVGPGLAPAMEGLLSAAGDGAPTGLRSALPSGTTELRADVRGGVADIVLPAGFDHMAVSEQILAVGQLVFTATANADVAGVRLTDGQRPVAVPDDAGRLVDRPVTRADYEAIAPS